MTARLEQHTEAMKEDSLAEQDPSSDEKSGDVLHCAALSWAKLGCLFFPIQDPLAPLLEFVPGP